MEGLTVSRGFRMVWLRIRINPRQCDVQQPGRWRDFSFKYCVLAPDPHVHYVHFKGKSVTLRTSLKSLLQTFLRTQSYLLKSEVASTLLIMRSDSSTVEVLKITPNFLKNTANAAPNPFPPFSSSSPPPRTSFSTVYTKLYNERCFPQSS